MRRCKSWLSIGLFCPRYQFQITPFNQLDRTGVVPDLSSEEFTGADAYDCSRFPATHNAYCIAYLERVWGRAAQLRRILNLWVSAVVVVCSMMVWVVGAEVEV